MAPNENSNPLVNVASSFLRPATLFHYLMHSSNSGQKSSIRNSIYKFLNVCRNVTAAFFRRLPHISRTPFFADAALKRHKFRLFPTGIHSWILAGRTRRKIPLYCCTSCCSKRFGTFYCCDRRRPVARSAHRCGPTRFITAAHRPAC